MSIKIKNWEKFQHYKDRNPPWIKLATDTFQNYEFSRLQDASKLLAICIWTLASRSSGGEVPDDLVWIKRQCNLGDMVTEKHLKELLNQGFISSCSKVLADCKQSARPETETETETETDISRKNALGEDFEIFWHAYPKKKSKGDAQKAFKALKGIAVSELVAAIERAKTSPQWQRDGGQYIPFPATWLRAKGWLDEPDKPALSGLDAFAAEMQKGGTDA